MAVISTSSLNSDIFGLIVKPPGYNEDEAEDKNGFHRSPTTSRKESRRLANNAAVNGESSSGSAKRDETGIRRIVDTSSRESGHRLNNMVNGESRSESAKQVETGMQQHPTSSPKEPGQLANATNGETRSKSAKRDETDGGGEDEDGRKLRSPPPHQGDIYDNGIGSDVNKAINQTVDQGMKLLADDVEKDGVDHGGKGKSDRKMERNGEAGDDDDGKRGLSKEQEEEERGRRQVLGERDGADIGGGAGARSGARGREGVVRDHGPMHADSWVLLNGKGEKEKPVYYDENIPDLVDRVEIELAGTSKCEKGAFDRLISVLSTLLPFVLVMFDELKTLKGKVKDLIVENRALQKEARQARDEKDRNRKETVTIGTTAMLGEGAPSQKHATRQDDVKTEDQRKQGSVSGSSDEESTAWTVKEKKMRHQMKELQRVNHSWEKYCQKLSGKHEIEVKERDAKLAAEEHRRKGLERRLEQKFKEYDQTLLHEKKNEDRQRALAEEYKRDRDGFRQKCDTMKNQLRESRKELEEKDAEIRRLNAVMESRPPFKSSKLAKKPERSSDIPPQTAKYDDDDENEGMPKPMTAVERQRSSATRCAPAGGAATQDVYVNMDRKNAEYQRVKAKPVRRTSERIESPPRSPPRSQSTKMANESSGEMSLTTRELTDQVLLYREQIDVFRSDFHQERQDREKAMGQVDSLKKELEKTKTTLKDMQKQRSEHELDLYAYADGYHERRHRHDTQKTRRREVLMRSGRQPGYGSQYEQYVALPEDHIYTEFD